MMGSEANPAGIARRLLRAASTATLATTLAGATGWPYASLVLFATAADGSPLLLLSDLALHSKNIAADGRIALLIDGTLGLDEPLAGPRLTVLGRAATTTAPRYRERYLARHPTTAGYAGFRDFRFYRVGVERGHLVAGFGRIDWLPGADLLVSDELAQQLAALEFGVIEHMNADHADAVRLYAERLVGVAGEGARLVGLDAEGCDIRIGARLFRLPFDRPVATADEVRAAFSELALRARATTERASGRQAADG